jgi:cytochrome c553
VFYQFNVVAILAVTLVTVSMRAQEPKKNPPKFDPAALFKKADTNGDGTLSKDEFIKLTSAFPKSKADPGMPAKWLAFYDKDQDGSISLDEFRTFVTPAAKRGVPKKSPPKAEPESATPPNAAQIAFFEKKIRPVLVGKCVECHSAEKNKLKGGLALDTVAGLFKGGDSGPAVVPGKPAESLLVKAIRHADPDLKMPPKEKLSDGVIADFEKWVTMGAPAPREAHVMAARTGIDIEKGREFWAFQPVKKPAIPAVKDTNWARTDTDRFLLAALEARGLKPVTDADQYTLLRRVYFDLTGLPPTPEEIAAFEKDSSDTAFEKVVDKLLASERFGERWGRHWLDVARFAESSGKEVDFAYPQAWRYRDYVIAAFNADTPFDQFIMEQLAGDLLPATDPRRQAELQIATGFLAVGPKSHIERNKTQFELDVADEQIDATTTAFLGLTVACARCHDHKFDPIPQADYYALAGIFRSTQVFHGTIRVVQNNNPGTLIELPMDCDQPAGIPPLSSNDRANLEKKIADYRNKLRGLQKANKLATLDGVQTRLRMITLEGKLPIYRNDGTPKLLAMGVRDKARPADSPLYVRGEVEKPGAVVPRGFVQVAYHGSMPMQTKGSGRLELAQWIASKDNPLTSRVYVNRVWMHLFGRGLVSTPDNFGASGEKPIHPELLDFLATTFMDDGWSTKTLVRRLVLSRAYRLASTIDAKNYDADPDNTLVWRMAPRRLDAEAIRDAMLLNAGKLDLAPPVGSMVATYGEGYATGAVLGRVPPDQRDFHRAVYLPMLRGSTIESLALFDGVDGSAVVGQRAETVIPGQSHYLLNSPHVLKLAQAAATRLAEGQRGSKERIRLAYLGWFGRPPTEAEVRAALKFIGDYGSRSMKTKRTDRVAESDAWTAFCQALWASGEFLSRR